MEINKAATNPRSITRKLVPKMETIEKLIVRELNGTQNLLDSRRDTSFLKAGMQAMTMLDRDLTTQLPPKRIQKGSRRRCA